MSVGHLIRQQLKSEEKFTDQSSSHFKTVYSRKFQITAETNLPQALTCRLVQL